MSAVSDEPIPTFADWVSRLGDVPPNRILAKPAPGTATEADVLRLLAADRPCELIDGVLVEKAMGLRESLMGFWLARVMGNFVELHDLGVIAGEHGTFRMAGGNVRMPDISFIAWDQFPGGQVPDRPIPAISPALAVEVLSQSNTRREMEAKRRDYFASGTRLVWEIDPDDRTVCVYTAITESAVLTDADQLDGGGVLPGFTVAVRDIFASLSRRR